MGAGAAGAVGVPFEDQGVNVADGGPSTGSYGMMGPTISDGPSLNYESVNFPPTGIMPAVNTAAYNPTTEYNNGPAGLYWGSAHIAMKGVVGWENNQYLNERLFPFTPTGSPLHGMILSAGGLPADGYRNSGLRSAMAGVDPFEEPFSWGGIGHAGTLTQINNRRSTLHRGYRVRYHLIPTNAVTVGDFRLTVRLQCKTEDGKWMTYDERYIECNERGVSMGMDSAVPVLGKKKIVITPRPVNGNQNEINILGRNTSHPFAQSAFYLERSELTGVGDIYGIKVNNSQDTLWWGAPLITAYDPRTSRFGHPMRPAYPREGLIDGIGTSPNLRNPSNPRAADPSGFGAGSTNVTNRPTLSTSQYPWDGSMLFANQGVPAMFMGFMAGKGAVSLARTWQIGTKRLAPQMDPAISADIEMSPGLRLVAQPTLNAIDYGWFPRFKDVNRYVSMAMTKTLTSVGGNLTWTELKMTNEANLPSFNQDMNALIETADLQAYQANQRVQPPGEYMRRNLFSDNMGITTPSPVADSLRPSSLMENVAPTKDDPYRQCYADPDDVVRRASGAFASDGGYGVRGDGLPEVQGTDGANRAVILNRPFRSVAELGYVFRGTPWKNLSFFNPESADGALLDAFCISEPPPVPRRDWGTGANSQQLLGMASAPEAPLVAGKVSLNTRQAPVLRALIAGALKDEADRTGTSVVTEEELDAAVSALLDRTTSEAEWLGPLTNVGELAGKVFAKDSLAEYPAGSVYTSTSYRTLDDPQGVVRNPQRDSNKATLTWHFTGYSGDLNSVFNNAKDKKNQRMRESIIRALADAGQTRVWNLLVDVIVQTGRIPVAGKNLRDFVKEGETRAWLHLAMDRFTGEVLDSQLEWVPE